MKTLPQTYVDALLGMAQEGLKSNDLSSYCRDLNLTTAELLNTISLEVAQRFISGELSYDLADDIMNGFFGVMFDVMGVDGNLPRPAFDIYQAFDEGEYQHLGDSGHIPPYELYTRPYLMEILLKHANHA